MWLDSVANMSTCSYPYCMYKEVSSFFTKLAVINELAVEYIQRGLQNPPPLL